MQIGREFNSLPIKKITTKQTFKEFTPFFVFLQRILLFQKSHMSHQK